jgi:hypothetical protein
VTIYFRLLIKFVKELQFYIFKLTANNIVQLAVRYYNQVNDIQHLERIYTMEDGCCLSTQKELCRSKINQIHYAKTIKSR